MKIGIITHHNVHNHGAHLQNFALIQVLNSFGHESKSLGYKKNYDFFDENAENKYNISVKSMHYYTKYFLQKGIRKTLFNIKKKNILSKFREDNSIVGEYYSRAEGLDCVFIGSDEVFSIETGLNPFFWGMGVPCKNIFSYAGCFGPTTIEFIKGKYAEEFIEAGTKRICKISVRDKNSQSIVEKISQKNAPIVCDPVILHGFQSEKKSFTKPIPEKYLLVYAYDNNMNDKDEVNDIITYAKSQGLLVVCAGFYHKWCDKNINVTPIELLQYIWGAECVVTDTFHGSVISLVINRPFAVKIRGNGNKLKYLLSEYGLEDRAVEDFSDLSLVFGKKIDYEIVNSIMAEKRKESLGFVKSCLGYANQSDQH
jgi:hypothetical protein